MSKTILIVEDNDLNMKLFNDLLQAHGYETVQTMDGRDVLDLAREHSPDLIIMDIFMPDLNGIEAIQWLKKGYPKTPIVAISGGATVAGRDCLELAKEKGADYTFRKPFKMAEFVETVGGALA